MKKCGKIIAMTSSFIFLFWALLFSVACSKNNYDISKCLYCEQIIDKQSKYCPNCGVKIQLDDNGNIISGESGVEKLKTTIEIKSKWTILKYIEIRMYISSQTPTLLENGRYHCSTTVSIAASPKSKEYSFDSAYFWVNYIAGGEQVLAKVILDAKGYGNGTMLLREITYNPKPNYNFPIESCVTSAGGTVSYYEKIEGVSTNGEI